MLNVSEMYRSAKDRAWMAALFVSGISAWFSVSNYYAQKSREKPNLAVELVELQNPRSDHPSMKLHMRNYGQGAAYDAVTFLVGIDEKGAAQRVRYQLASSNPIMSGVDLTGELPLEFVSAYGDFAVCSRFEDREQNLITTEAFMNFGGLPARKTGETVGEVFIGRGVDDATRDKLRLRRLCQS